MGNMSNIYITTPIYYVNDKPHVGHAYTSIASDVLARFYRLKNYEVFFLTGTDEHGQKIQQATKNNNLNTQEFVDSMSLNFQNLTKTLNLSNNDFVRTSSQRHIEAVRTFWEKLNDNGQIYLDKYSGWYSIRDEAFYNEDEIIDGLAPTGAPVEWVEESSYFFKLSEWEEKLLKFYSDNPTFIQPKSRYNEVVSFVKQGLKDLSISRTSFDWGVKVPGDESHVVYVWIDALTNYLTALGYPNNESKPLNDFWPANFHFVGKDILRFHAVYWPALLMAAGMDLPRKIIAHGWWTVEKEKMSKSLGNVVNPEDIINKYGLDQFRYFLLREVPFGNDGDFSEDALISRINSELANNFGNLVNRVFSMTKKSLNGVIPEQQELKEEEQNLINICDENLSEYMVCFKSVEFSKAIDSVVGIISMTNKYIDNTKPWALAKEGKVEDLKRVLRVSLEVIRLVSILFYPIIPSSSIKILKALNLSIDEEANCFAGPGSVASLVANDTIGDLDLLFPKIDKNLT